MTGIINDELLLEIAKEELTKYANAYSSEGFVMGNVYSERINAVYNLLVKIYGKPYLKAHGIELVEE